MSFETLVKIALIAVLTALFFSPLTRPAHAQATNVVEITKISVTGRGNDVNVLMSLQQAFHGEGLLVTDQPAAGCPKLHVTGTIDVEVEQRSSDYTIDFNHFGRRDGNNRRYIPPIRSDTRSEEVWATATLTIQLRNAEDKLPLAFESGQGFAHAVISVDTRFDNGYGRNDRRRNPDDRKRQLQQQALDQAAANVAAKLARHLNGGGQPVGQPTASPPATYAPAPTTTLQVVPATGVDQPNTTGWLACTGRLSAMSGTGNVAGWLRQGRMAPVYINGRLTAYIVRRDTTQQDVYHFLLDPTYNLREGTSYTIDVPSPP